MRKHFYDCNASLFTLCINIDWYFFRRFGFEEMHLDKYCHCGPLTRGSETSTNSRGGGRLDAPSNSAPMSHIKKRRKPSKAREKSSRNYVSFFRSVNITVNRGNQSSNLAKYHISSSSSSTTFLQKCITVSETIIGRRLRKKTNR